MKSLWSDDTEEATLTQEEETALAEVEIAKRTDVNEVNPTLAALIEEGKRDDAKRRKLAGRTKKEKKSWRKPAPEAGPAPKKAAKPTPTPKATPKPKKAPKPPFGLTIGRCSVGPVPYVHEHLSFPSQKALVEHLVRVLNKEGHHTGLREAIVSLRPGAGEVK